MNDPPTHDETVERGFNPMPPTMMQRRLASPAPTFGTQYGAPGPVPAHYGGASGYDYGTMDQYGQYNQQSSATSAHPMYNQPNSAYGQSPFSPVTSPYNGGQTADLARQPSSATQLSRQPSAGPNLYLQDDAQYATYHNQGQTEYADLDRSSVTPYQAAQYAEISKQLNADVPLSMGTPAFNEHNMEAPPPVPGKDTNSPFADPIPAVLLAGGSSADAAVHPGPSMDSDAQNLNDFPAPPSPAHSLNHQRIDSTPPMLPEIHVESRPQSYDFPASVRGSGVGSGYPSGVTKDFLKSPLGSQFPATPSPLASSFGIPTPPAAAMSFPMSTAREVKPAENKRPETIYDDEDAYAGI